MLHWASKLYIDPIDIDTPPRKKYFSSRKECLFGDTDPDDNELEKQKKQGKDKQEM